MSKLQFFETIHGYAPFPWQNEVGRRLEVGEDIDFVRVPTAAGKSALVDLAIYAALHGGRRRICFVVDRRIVVDDVHQRAALIAAALDSNSALAELKSAAGEIQIIRLRGGVYGDDDWVLYPDRLTILISTVDQIGSRLLFRGYGVSSRMAHQGDRLRACRKLTNKKVYYQQLMTWSCKLPKNSVYSLALLRKIYDAHRSIFGAARHTEGARSKVRAVGNHDHGDLRHPVWIQQLGRGGRLVL